MTSATALQARTFAPGLTVNDIRRSVRFYTDGLGFLGEMALAPRRQHGDPQG